MGLFSFLFSRNKIIRKTEEAESVRMKYLGDYELFTRVERSDALKRYRELQEYIESPLFKKRKKEVDALSYENSEYYTVEKKHKAYSKQRKLRDYYTIKDSEEFKEYTRIKESEQYTEFIRLRGIVEASGFSKKMYRDEYEAYKKLLKDSKIAALLKFEKNSKYKHYAELLDTSLPKEYEQLSAFIQSDEFKKNKAYLQNKNRFQTTDDYKLQSEYETLKKDADILKYFVLGKDPYFSSMKKWEPAFEDDFSAGKLDSEKWITKYYAGERFLKDTYATGDDVQLFTDDNISFNRQFVCLNFKKESIVGKYWDTQLGIKEKKFEYTSAMISTAGSYRQLYGRFEAKIRLSHSAVAECFWLLGDTSVPHVEIMRSSVEGVRVGDIYPDQKSIGQRSQLLNNLKLANEYYIFTLEWTKEKMVWMVNDFVVKEVHEHIPDIPMYIIFSLGATEAPAEKYLPAKMEIGWVRTFKLKGE